MNRLKKLFLCFCLCFPLTAVSAQYRFDSWTTENGLPHNSIQGIRQTRDGYLWLATMNGLVRFDGVKFRIFNKVNTAAINDNRFAVFALYEDSRGALWAGTISGGVVRYENGEFTSFTTKDGLQDNHVYRIDEDESGAVWIYTGNGLARWTNGKLEKIAPQENSPFNDYLCAPPNVGADGFLFGLWRINADGWQRFAYGKWSKFPLPAGVGDSSKFQIGSIVEDSKRRVWYQPTGEHTVYYGVSGENLTVYPNFPKGFFVCYSDADGNLWLTDGGGHTGIWKNGKLEIFEDLSTPSIVRVLEDREGNLWVGTRENGLFRRRTQTVKTLRDPNVTGFDKVGGLMEDSGGKVWLAADGLKTFENDHFASVYNLNPTDKSLNLGDVYSLYEDRDGSIIIGAWNDVGRYRNGILSKDERLSAISPNTLRTVRRDVRGDLWLGYNSGIYRLTDSGELTHFTTENGLPDYRITAFWQDKSSTIWVGTENGLARFDGSKFTPIPELSGDKPILVTAIYEDANSILWIGTRDTGLFRLVAASETVSVTHFTENEGLYSNNIFQILEDDAGFFWMSNHLGIFRVERRSLDDFAANRLNPVRSNYFGKADGMLNTLCAGGVQTAGFKAHDGKLWFPTQNGAAIIDPRNVKFNKVAPPVVIEEIYLDQTPVDSHRDLTVQPSQENLQINYTALSLTKSDQIRFRYKLENLDRDWTEAGTNRTVNYTHLPPGEYFFRVIADNGDGVWNTEGASLRIKILPPFYRTVWFSALCIAAIIGAGFAFYKIRINQSERRRLTQENFSRRLINAHEAERRRVAGELHDSIGQTLAMIKNRAAFGSQAENDAEAKEQLAAITSQTTQAIGEVREISYNLRPYLLETLGLTKAIRSLVKKVEEVHLLNIDARIDDVDGLFSNESEMSVYRIIQESLNNVAKHSDADEATLTIEKNGDEVTIVIADNGRGFDQNAAPQTDAGNGGFGLLGITERVRMLGGTLDIQTAVGGGTKLTIKVAGMKNF